MSLDDILYRRLDPAGGVVELDDVPDHAPTEEPFAYRMLGGPVVVVGAGEQAETALWIPEDVELPEFCGGSVLRGGIAINRMAKAPKGIRRFEISRPDAETPVVAISVVAREPGWSLAGGKERWWIVALAAFDSRGLLLDWYDASRGLLSDTREEGPSQTVALGFVRRRRELPAREMTWAAFQAEKAEQEEF